MTLDELALDRIIKDLLDTARANPEIYYAVVDTAKAAEITGIAAATLVTMRSRGGGPPYVSRGRRSVGYLLIDLLLFNVRARRRNTSDVSTNAVDRPRETYAYDRFRMGNP